MNEAMVGPNNFLVMMVDELSGLALKASFCGQAECKNGTFSSLH